MKTVTIYTTPTCPFCKRLKEFLDNKGVEYENRDVLDNETNLEEMKKYSGGAMTVPVIILNKDQEDQEMQIGFDLEKISDALGI